MRTLHRTLTILCCFAVALLLAWKLLHAANYGFTFWYSQLQIEEHISKYAPQNRQGKTGFEKTEKADRIELFRAIGHAVNNGGEGLRTLNYRAHPDAKPLTLLTDPEAVHLEDVAKLIDLLVPLGWAALGLLIVLIIIARVGSLPLPGLGISVITLLCTVLVLGLVIAAIGPRQVFRWMHEAVFPDDHQWFFYYQDSLMTTLMKAPDIFFAIGAVWALLAAIIYLLISLLFRVIDVKKTAS